VQQQTHCIFLHPGPLQGSLVSTSIAQSYPLLGMRGIRKLTSTFKNATSPCVQQLLGI
jgi:hypothetical protein